MAGDGGAQLRIDALAPAGVSRGNRQRTSGMASRALMKSSSRGPGYASGAWSTARSGRFGRARVRGISLEHGADEAIRRAGRLRVTSPGSSVRQERVLRRRVTPVQTRWYQVTISAK